MQATYGDAHARRNGLVSPGYILQRESGLYALADAVERAAGSVIMTTSHGFPSVGITMAGGVGTARIRGILAAAEAALLPIAPNMPVARLGFATAGLGALSERPLAAGRRPAYRAHRRQMQAHKPSSVAPLRSGLPISLLLTEGVNTNRYDR